MRKVLWVSKKMIPQISDQIGEKKVFIEGWIEKLAEEISRQPETTLCLSFPYNIVVKGKVNDIYYHSFILSPNDRNNSIGDMIAEVKPDVIEIFGTEDKTSFEVAKKCNKLGLSKHVVIHIQGLVSIIERHYYSSLPFRIIYGFTLRDLIKGNLFIDKHRLKRAGKHEQLTLSLVGNVIGRTDWDKSTTSLINPNAKYFFNNEMLREPFYNNRWDLASCKKHSIFTGHATTPIKGLHILIEAVKILKEEFPDIILKIPGKSYTAKPIFKLSKYESYIIELIKKYSLEKNVLFVGNLDENQMCKMHMESNVFVSSSFIENSPNTLCEAMILGVPVVASFVGGVSNLIENGKDGFLYQADAPYMLAYYIKQIFLDDSLALFFSQNEREKSMKRHDPENVIQDLLSIYKEIK